MKITLPNGTVIEHEGALEIGGLLVSPVVHEKVAAPEVVDVTTETVEESDDPYEGEDEVIFDDEEDLGRVVTTLNKKRRYPTEVASLTKALRDAYFVLARFDNDQGVHYSNVSRELDISMAAAVSRCWALRAKHGLATNPAGNGRYRAVMLPDES